MKENTQTSNFNVDYKAAKELVQKGSIVKAMQLYYDLHLLRPDSVEILCELVRLNLQLGLLDQAAINLNQLITLEPTNKAYYDQLANCYAQQKSWDKACMAYHALLLQRPKLPEAHFNLAFYSRRAGLFEEAIKSYKKAISLGISKPEEIYLNIGLIYSDDLRQMKNAKQYLEKSIQENNEYIAAHNNLANYYEDLGEISAAINQFEKILEFNPDNAQALSRIAFLSKVDDESHPLLTKISALAARPDISQIDKLDLCYAMGKLLDDCGEYPSAFSYYHYANQLNQTMVNKYNPEMQAEYTNKLISFFDQNWMQANTLNNTETPIFICGMFRSGSTLVDQILGSHSKILAGGEREYFQRLVREKMSPFPEAASQFKSNQLLKFAEEYTTITKNIFSESLSVTDKRPDNLSLIGLIKTIFPKAKIVYTKRNNIDNCLSVYFLRLSKDMNYATNLLDIANFYQQQEKLMQHWQKLFPDDFIIVDYDKLIDSPRVEIESMLGKLGFDWEDTCEDFYKLNNSVKTASAWQVRQPLYKKSSGRAKNYIQIPQVKELSDYFKKTSST